MQKLVFINGAGNQIDLTAGNFGITNWSGLSNTGLNIQTQQVPFEDGGVFLDALMEQREIEVTVAIYDGNNLELRYQKKRELISALNPKLGEGTLIYTNNHLSRQIKAVPQIPLFENKNSNDAGTLKASVAFSCPSPYWEDVNETVIGLQGGTKKTLLVDGDVSVGFTVEYKNNNAVNPQIILNNELIKYNGTISKDLIINTNVGKKSAITKDFKTNIEALNFVATCSIELSDNKILLGGKEGFCVYNSNTKKVENRIIISGKYFNDIIKVNTTFYAVATDVFIFNSYQGYANTSYIYSSTNGEEWTLVSTVTSTDIGGTRASFKKLKYVNGVFYILNTVDAQILKTTDFATYTQIYSYFGNNYSGQDLYVDENIIIIVGGYRVGGYSYPLLVYSTDFETFNNASVSYYPMTNEYCFITKIIKKGSYFYATLGDVSNVYILKSSNGISWSNNNLGFLSSYNCNSGECSFIKGTDNGFIICYSQYDMLQKNSIVLITDNSLNLITVSNTKKIFTSVNELYFGDEILYLNESYFSVIETFVNYDFSQIFYIYKLKKIYLLLQIGSQVTGQNSYYINVLYGEDLNKLTSQSLVINGHNVSNWELHSICEYEDFVYIFSDYGILKIDNFGISQTDFNISGLTTSVSYRVGFDGTYIYSYHFDKIYKLDKNFKIVKIYDLRNKAFQNTSFSYLGFVKEGMLIAFDYGATGLEARYGVNYTITLDENESVYDVSTYRLNDENIFFDFRNREGWLLFFHSLYFDKAFIRIGTGSRLIVNNGYSTQQIDAGITSLLNDNMYPSTYIKDNILYIGYEDTNYVASDISCKLIGGDYKGNCYYVDLNNNVYVIKHNTEENCISKITGDFNLKLKINANNEIALDAESGEVVAIIKFRQKYIGV